MASNTIAKLAVIISGDASPLTKSLDKAAERTKKFAREDIDVLQTKFGQLQSIMGSLQSGNIMGLAGGVMRLAGPYGAIAAATGAIAYNLASASDAQSVLVGSADTWAAQVARLAESSAQLAIAAGRPVARGLMEATKEGADLLAFATHKLLPEAIKKELELLAIRNKQNAELQRGIDLRTTEQRAADKDKAKFDALLKTRADLAGSATRLDSGKLRFTDPKTADAFEKNKFEIQNEILRKQLVAMDKLAGEAQAERGREMVRELQEANRQLQELNRKKPVEFRPARL